MTPEPADRRTTPIILIRSATYDELRGEADAAATAEGLAPTDIGYGPFTAHHITEALEAAYRSNPDADESVPPGDGELTFVGVSLAPDLAAELTSLAETEADRQGVSGDEEDREDFASRYIGRRLDDCYRQRN
jgi:hypothetical protein